MAAMMRMAVPVIVFLTVVMPVAMSMAAVTMSGKRGWREGHGADNGGDHAKIAKHYAFLSSSDWKNRERTAYMSNDAGRRWFDVSGLGQHRFAARPRSKVRGLVPCSDVSRPSTSPDAARHRANPGSRSTGRR
jgi:hypothetical protein